MKKPDLSKYSWGDPFDFPEGIVRVTGGHGGESWLILGSEKIALYDCGMAFAADDLVENIRKALGERTLDYVLLSHSHFDHVGALPQVKRAWPNAKVVGSAYCKKVFGSEGAKKTMLELGTASAKAMGGEHISEIIVDGMDIDLVVGEGDTVSLGEETIRVIEGKGHTNCSLAYALEPAKYLFASESTGVMDKRPGTHTSILKSYEDAMDTSRRCREYGASRIFSPHYGVCPEGFVEDYWNLFEWEAIREREIVLSMYERGCSKEEMLERLTKEYWYKERAEEQTYEAFSTNAMATISMYDPERNK